MAYLIFDFMCDHCQRLAADLLVRKNERPECDQCGRKMRRCLASPRPVVITKGRKGRGLKTPSGIQEFVTRERERLTKRSDAFDRSARGREEMDKAIDRQIAVGNIPAQHRELHRKKAGVEKVR